VLQGFFHAGLQVAASFYPQAQNNVYLRRIAPVQDVFSSAQGRYFF